MTPEERIAKLSEELENLSLELLEGLETLNYHSLGEAVRDMKHGVFRTAERMRQEALTLLRTLSSNGYMTRPETDLKTIDELQELGAMLDVLRRVSAEPKSYHHFIEELPPLLKVLEKWTLDGLQPVEGLAYHEEE